MYSLKYLIIFAICLAYFCYSMGYNIQGPTWLDLQYLLGEKQDRMSYGRSAVTIGYCLGCVMNGFLFEWFNRQHLMVYNLILMGLSVLLTPMIPNYVVFLALSALYGLSGSGTDIACNVWAMEIGAVAFTSGSGGGGGGSADTGPMMQLLHLFYALGATFSSVVSEPFLMADHNHRTDGGNGGNVTASPVVESNATRLAAGIFTGPIPVEVVPVQGHHQEGGGGTQIQICYTIAAVITFTSAALMGGLYVFRKKWERYLVVAEPVSTTPPPLDDTVMADPVTIRPNSSMDSISFSTTSDSETGLVPPLPGREVMASVTTGRGDTVTSVSGRGDKDEATEEAAEPNRAQSRAMKIWTISMGAIIIGFYCGIEVISFQYFLTFLYHKGVQKGLAASMNTAFNANYAVGRVLGIFIAMKVPILWILVGHLSLSVLSYMALVTWAGNSAMGAWVGAVAIGLGYSANYPGIYSYVGEKVPMTNTIGSILMVTGGIASTIGPIIVGSSIESDPDIFIYINALFVAVVFLSIGILEVSLVMGFPGCFFLGAEREEILKKNKTRTWNPKDGQRRSAGGLMAVAAAAETEGELNKSDLFMGPPLPLPPPLVDLRGS